MSDVNAVIVQPFKQFVKVRRAASKTSIAASRDASRNTHLSHTQDSIHLVKKCTKPDRKEFARIASATMIGFLIMGFVGFFVKLVHIPINNILMT